jgi:hypothetical protein
MISEKWPAKCEPCGQAFAAEIIVNAPINVSVASMNAVRCPKCNAGPKGILVSNPPKKANGVRQSTAD